MVVRDAYVLVGPTASGKSDVGHHLAEHMHAAILSADSMLVYQGMDIGTAKPSPEERGGVPYLGIDLVKPDDPFDVWAYLRLVSEQTKSLPPKMPVLIVGGSGLYVKALLQGLDVYAAAPMERERWEQVYAQEGVPGLQSVLSERDPAALGRLADPLNPRRLIRAIEQTYSANGIRERERAWNENVSNGKLAGLLPENTMLRARIVKRVARMYEVGLLDEARMLRNRYAALSRTASQAIGYAEAFAVLDGEMTVKQAQERTVVRTNRLAKRQRTWFRHQADVAWLSPAAEHDISQMAIDIENIWRKHGSIQLRIA